MKQGLANTESDEWFLIAAPVEFKMYLVFASFALSRFS